MFQPQLRPAPDWTKISKNQPDNNWLPAFVDGELMPYTHRMMQLSPRGGSPIAGLCDMWNSFGSERIDSTHLTVLTDLIPSISDTLLQTGGVFDAHAIGKAAETWANTNPGVPCRLSNSLMQAAKVGIWNSTLTLDIEFKERLPEQGLEWAFSRVVTRELRDGRMDAEVTICDQRLRPICVARHIVLVLDARRTSDKQKQKEQRGGSML